MRQSRLPGKSSRKRWRRGIQQRIECEISSAKVNLKSWRSMPSPALLFDIGNVLVRFDFSVAAQRLAGLSTATVEEVFELLSPFKDDLECGRISNDDFIAQSIERI